jgi:hypothetical protein
MMAGVNGFHNGDGGGPVTWAIANEKLQNAYRSVALARTVKDKLRALQTEALKIVPLIQEGVLLHGDVADVLYEVAFNNNLIEQVGEVDFQQALSEWLDGRAAIESEGLTVGPEIRANGAAPASVGSLVMRCAADIAPKSVPWLWPNRFALGKHSMIGGEGGLSKSQFLAYLAASTSTGALWPANEGRAVLGNVIMFSAEDDPDDTIIPRLIAAGADLSRIRIVEAARDANGERLFDVQRDLKALEQAIQDFGDVRLVTFDPISSYLGSKVDGNSNNDIRRVLEPLSRIAARHQTAIVSLTHSPKGTGAKALNQFIGSAAFVNVVRAAFLMMRDPEDATRILFLVAKVNLGKEPQGLAYRIGVRFVGPDDDVPAPHIVWENDPVAMTADEALAAANAGPEGKSATAEAADFLQELLGGGPVPATDIKSQADAYGISWSAVKRAKKALGVLTTRRGVEGERGGGRWLWSLPGSPGLAVDEAIKGLRGSRGNVSPLIENEPLEPLGGDR